jgi:transcriptional regulator with XRE-family HTH domain
MFNNNISIYADKSSDFYMDFSTTVKKQLKQRGKTQKWLAAQLGITPQTANRILKNPTFDTIRRIDAVLPLPEAAGLLHSGKRLARYVGKDPDVFEPEIMGELESLSLGYSDVLQDPEARAEFYGLARAILELSTKQRQALTLLLESFDTPTK